MVHDAPGERIRALGLGDNDLAAWQQSGLSSAAFDDWITDRVARRPSGDRARELYGAEDVHDFARRAILDALALSPDDRLLEIGCGGGLLLRDALRTGAQVTGIDHSEDMADLARQRVDGAEVMLGDAAALPFTDHSFTAIAMSVVFLFLPDPAVALSECRRVLAADGRLAIYTNGPELRGSAAAPEPIASLGRFYTDDQLVTLARDAGLRNVRVANDSGGQLLTGTDP